MLHWPVCHRGNSWLHCFESIGSTDAVNASTNTDSAASSAVFIVDGTNVSTSTFDLKTGGPGGLWSSSLIAQPVEGIDGTVYSDAYVSTETVGNGVEYNTAVYGAYGLGSNNYGTDPSTGMNTFSTPQVQVGFISSTQTGSNWAQIPNNNS